MKKCKCGAIITKNNALCHQGCDPVINDCCGVFLADIRNKLIPMKLILEIIKEEKVIPDTFLSIWKSTIKQAEESIEYIKKLGN